MLLCLIGMLNQASCKQFNIGIFLKVSIGFICIILITTTRVSELGPHERTAWYDLLDFSEGGSTMLHRGIALPPIVLSPSSSSWLSNRLSPSHFPLMQDVYWLQTNFIKGWLLCIVYFFSQIGLRFANMVCGQQFAWMRANSQCRRAIARAIVYCNVRRNM